MLTSRRLVIASVVFGLFVLFDLALFGWLILKSLSQREIEEVLLETRQEAEPYARELEEQAQRLGGDLWVVMTVAQETRTNLETMLSKSEIVQKIEVQDRDGNLVYGPHWSRENAPLIEMPPIPRNENGELPAPPALSFDTVEIPIGEIGTLVIRLSDEEVQKRIGVLRADLIRQTSVIGGLTLVLLVGAFIALWRLFQRARGLEEQAIEAERLATIGALASGLAHEIRNPLNSLSLNMQMLEEEGRERSISGSQMRLLALTRSELGRLERLATDFLAYAKPRSLELEKIPARDLLERVRAILDAEAHDRGVELAVNDPTAGAEIEVDRAQVNQMLLNLVQNALAAAVEGGENPPRVELAVRRLDERLALEVRDNGPGIPAEERDRIFELFYSTRKGGTGLGLAIVQRIAGAHGAEIEIAEAEPRGTVIRIAFPAAETTPIPRRRSGVFELPRIDT